MGLQSKGAKGGQSALKAFFEKQESTVLQNIGQQLIYPKVKSALGISDSKLLQGTIFQKIGTKQQVELTDSTLIVDNTTSTDRNTAAILGNTNAFLSRSSVAGVQPSIIYDGNGNAIASAVPSSISASATANALSNATPYAGSIRDITAAANAGSVAATALSGGSVSSMLASAGKGLSSLGTALMSGALKAGDIDAILGRAEVPYRDSNGNLVPGLTTSESTPQQVGAIFGTAALGLAVGQGIVTASKGGVKDVSGGVGESVAALTPIASGIAKALGAATDVTKAIPIVGAIIGGAASLIGAFTPSGQTARANAIAKTIFTQTYLAPQAMNVTQGSNGGYADFNTAGGVRTSDFSPYPIISQSYADVPRRVDVPGHTLSPFGGYQTVTGAKTPSAPTYHVTINALDSRSIVDRSGDIVDAFHVGIQSGFHPVVNSLAGQLGLR